MIKKTITYTDFNGNPVTEDLYFNLTAPEIVELEVEYDEGLTDALKRMIENKNNKALFAEFKRIIGLSYGEKSEDGRHFRKSDQIRDDFEQSAAYGTVWMEFFTNDLAAIEFIIGILPADLQVEARKLVEAEKVETAVTTGALPPPADPSAPTV